MQLGDDTERDRVSPSEWTAVALGVYLPLSVGSLGWMVWSVGSMEAWNRIVGRTPSGALALGIGLGLFLVLLTGLTTHYAEWGRRLEHAFAKFLGPLSVSTCLALAAASAIGEELFFRGVLPPAIGLTWATVLFGAIHIPADRDMIPWPFFAAGAGALFGWAFLHTGGLLAPIAAHFVVNAINLTLMSRVASRGLRPLSPG